MFNLAFIIMNNSTNPTQIIMKIKSVNHDIDIICDAVAVVTKANPMAKDRVRENVDARRIVYKVCREMLNLTYIRIAKYFDKNHAEYFSTVEYYCVGRRQPTK